jgi:hypothetical protein
MGRTVEMDCCLADVKQDVESSYPIPLAAACRRCRQVPLEDVGGKHRSLIDLFEVHVKFLTIVALQDARNHVANLVDRLPQKEKALEFLKRPSLGAWVGLLRTLCKLEDVRDRSHWLKVIAEWYSADKTNESASALEALESCDVNLNRRSRMPHAELCNALVTYRNKQFAHAASLHQNELSKRLLSLEYALAYLLRSTPFLAQMQILFTQRIEIAPDGTWQVTALRLNGTAEEPLQCRAEERLELSELYLGQSADAGLDGRPIPLGPFLLWTRDGDRQRNDLFFYNDAWRTKLEYLSYTSGEFYYHRELHRDFSELITLKLHPGMEEDVHRGLSPQEREEHAESCLKRSMVLRDQGQLEDALGYLEDGLEYDRQPLLFLEMARVQIALGDPAESVRQTLQSCLEIRPDLVEARQLLAQLDTVPEPLDETDIPPPEEMDEEMPHLTALHAVLPQALRSYAGFVWCLAAAGYYGISGGLECLVGGPRAAIPPLLQLASMVALIMVIVIGRTLLLRTRLPLSLQLDAMRLERFHRWHDEQMQAVFGRFVFLDGRLRYRDTFRAEKAYWWGGIAWTLIITASGFFLSGSCRAPILLWPKRLVDYGWMYAVAYPGARYVLGLTAFVYRFSRLSLKPMLSTINDDGLRCFGPLFAVSIALASLWYTAYWTLAATVVHTPWYGDFFFLGLASFFYVSWSMGLPLAIRRSAREARSKAIHIYADHIDSAFKAFLANPSDDTLDRYQWIRKNQGVIKAISTWPLTVTQTTAVIGSNVLLLGVDTLYILVRMGVLGTVTSALATGPVPGL